MKKIQMLTNMLDIQNELNIATNGAAWTDGVTEDGKTINWKRCIYMECAEFIDSFPWKHWKKIKAEINWANAEIELADMWHFFLSEIKATNYDRNLDKIVTEIIEKAYKSFSNTDNFEEIIQKAEELINEATAKKSNLTQLLMRFFELMALFGFSFDKMYKIYIGKSILNHFRQENGYKEKSPDENTYIKIWNGQEDNMIMLALIENISVNDLSKQLPKLLAEEYSKIQK